MRNPQPSDDELGAIYTEHYFLDRGPSGNFTPETDRLKQQTAALYLDEIEARLRLDATSRRGLKLLEIGPGLGHLLVEASSRGYDVMGIEYSASSVHVANARLGAPRVRQGSLGAVPLPVDGFDVVVMADVIEHTRDPAVDLGHAWNALRPGGLLFLALPSLDSWSARLLGRRWMEYKLEHLYYFSERTIQAFLAKAGFEDTTVSGCRKVLNLQYISEHFDQYPVPLISPLVKFGCALLPRGLRRKGLTLVASGMNVTARRSERPSPRDRAEVLSVVMPAFNERATVSQVMERLLTKQIPGVALEIIVVESNSTDGTREEVRRFEQRPGVTVIYEDRPQGKGHAVRTGLARATGDYVLIQDADLEYDMDDYEPLLAPLRAGQASFVLGARHGKHGASWKMRHFTDQVMVGQVMNVGHVFFTLLFNLFYGTRLSDPFTMYKVFRREAIRGLTFEANRFDFDWELVGKLVRAGHRPIEIPVSYSSRSFAEGKKVSFFRDPLTWFWACVKFRFQPLRRGRDADAYLTQPPSQTGTNVSSRDVGVL
jgi:glycosyltransferase involved in cell wall biosynthesis/SAM-dependent methyltransferase